MIIASYWIASFLAMTEVRIVIARNEAIQIQKKYNNISPKYLHIFKYDAIFAPEIMVP